MANDGISLNEAMTKWHLTEAQAKKLDKMDNDGENGKITGNVY